VEIETTLAICAETPDSIVREVANLTRIGRFVFTPRPEKAIRDVYLELPGGELRSRGCGLRLRSVDGEQLITLKGRAARVAGGGLRRDETELEWSREGMGEIVDHLAELGVLLDLPDPAREWEDPETIVSRMGFVADQIRSTVRRPRDVSPDRAASLIVAELVIDSVVYFLQAGDVRHHEIEVEAKGTGTVEDIQEVSNTLLGYLPGSLREWHFGKRATGRAVANILAERGSPEILSPSGDLLPGSYDQILVKLQ